MGSGQYRHRIDIQSSTDTVDALGETTQTWATLIECVPASKNVGEAREVTIGGQTKSVRTVLFKTRYDDRILIGQRISHGGSAYDITDVRDPKGYCRNLEITATLSATC